MTDDELIERLRRTLQTEAAAIHPNPADHPTDALHGSRPGARVLRRRWPLAVAATAAAVAAGVTLAVLNWPGGGGTRIGVAGPGPSVSPAPASPGVDPRAVVVDSPRDDDGAGSRGPSRDDPGGIDPHRGHRLPPRSGGAVATTVPPARARPVGLVPARGGDVRLGRDGWVAGRVPCGSGWCLAMARTTNGGQTWTAAPAPKATVSTAYGAGAASVRFADPMDGWIYAVDPTRVWSTHDGGSRLAPGAGAGLPPAATITAMEASGGYVWVAALLPNARTVHLERSPVGADAWTDINTGVSIGAGPVPATQLVLHGRYGWLLENDRTVVGGARLNGSGQWLRLDAALRDRQRDRRPGRLLGHRPGGHVRRGDLGAAPQSPGRGRGPVHLGVHLERRREQLPRRGCRPAGSNPAASNPAGLASPAPATIVRGQLAAGGSGGDGRALGQLRRRADLADGVAGAVRRFSGTTWASRRSPRAWRSRPPGRGPPSI